MSAKVVKLRDIAAKIGAHLKRFEADKLGVNKDDRGDGTGCRPYYIAGAGVAGRYVWVRYVSYQGAQHLTREEALAYLAWLDAGNVGRHFQALPHRRLR